MKKVINNFTLSYNEKDDRCELNSYNGDEEIITVPDGVTNLGFRCFEKSEHIREVQIPDTVKYVCWSAFYKRGINLADENGFCKVGKFLINYVGTENILIIPDGIKVISHCAFVGSEKIQKIIFPEGIEKIDIRAFEGCSELEEVVFDVSTTSLKEIGDDAFAGCKKLRKINIPRNIEKIGRDIFKGCTLLYNNEACYIGPFFFGYYGTVKDITIPDDIKIVAPQSFYNNDINTVIIPKSVEVIGEKAFAYCKDLEKAVINGTIEIKEEAFFGTAIKEIDIPRSVESIGEKAFARCKDLEKAVINGAIEIKKDAFAGCEKLSDVFFPEGLKTIESSYYSGAFSGTAVKKIDIPRSVESIGDSSFRNCKELEEVTILGGAKLIGKAAFYGCSKLRYVDLGSDNEVLSQESFQFCQLLTRVKMSQKTKCIGEEAFYGCWALSEINIPDGIEEIGDKAFYECPRIHRSCIPSNFIHENGDDSYNRIGIGDENAFIIKDDVLIKYTGDSEEVVVPDGIRVIEKNAICTHQYGKIIKKIVLPDSLRLLNDNYWVQEINLPKTYLRQMEKLPNDVTLTMLRGAWKDSAEIEDFAWLYLFQSGKDLIEYCVEKIKDHANEAANCFINILDGKKKAAAYTRAAEFIFEHKNQIEQELINRFYQIAINIKAKKAIEILECIAEANSKEKKKNSVQKNTREIEAYCQKNYSKPLLEKSQKKACLKDSVFGGVYYKNSDEKVPAFIVKCAVLPYIDLMTERPKRIADYKKDYLRLNFCEDADKIVQEFDHESFVKVLEKIANLKNGHLNPQCVIPLARFGDSEQIKAIVSAMNQWTNWDVYSSKGRSSIIVARGAVLLSDTREAMLYADQHKCLGYYAAIRKLDIDTLRDSKLADFGLDGEGKKIVDIGSTSIEISIGKDLELKLYNITADKEVKSIPKKGSDTEKYDAAKNILADLKRNLKKVVKTHNDNLFERFLDGSSKSAIGWKEAYFNNPLLHKIAELIVWNQKERTFTLGADGPIDSYGQPYHIEDNIAIGVAHPIMMKSNEINRWQSYMTSKGLKQPFEQIWEPVIQKGSVHKDRFKGLMIPFYRLKGHEKDGIKIDNYDFHTGEIEISFSDCNSEVNRIDYRWHDISMDDRFEIVEIGVSRNTRRANHIIAYLDKITIYGRIANDDEAIIDILDGFTIAQITDFIQIAIESNSNNVLAALMDYKNKHYADIDPMDEFVL